MAIDFTITQLFLSKPLVSLQTGYLGGLMICSSSNSKQGRRDLNPQPLVLETSALPIELHPFDSRGTWEVTRDRTGNALNNQ